MKILIVDDTHEDLYLYEVILKNMGHEVITATNGAKALELLNSQSVDLIVSDILMPVVDGFRLCKALKDDPKFAHIPFVFLTATYKDEPDKKLAFELGAAKFLQKPMEPNEFVDAIETICKEIESGKIKAVAQGADKQETIFTLYNERMVRKLEKKTLELEKEIIERKKTEAVLRKTAKNLEALSQSNHALVRAVDENDLLQSICRIIVEAGSHDMATILLFDGNKLLYPAASFGDENCYETTPDSPILDFDRISVFLSSRYRANQAGSEEDNHVLLSDSVCPSYVVLPIDLNGNTSGGVIIRSRSRDAFEKDEVIILQRLVSDLAYGLNALRMKKEAAETRRALNESEEKYRKLVQNSLMGVFIVHQSSYTFVNERFAQLLGTTAKDLEGSLINRTAFGAGNSDLEFALKEMMSAPGVPKFIESSFVNGKGERRWLAVSLIDVSFNGCPSVLGNAMDITERKLVENKLTEALANLTASNDELKQFAYVCSHDLQEPLRNVTNAVQFLERRYGDKLDKQAHEFINYAVVAAGRATALINDLLIYSRIGTQIQDFESVNMQSVLEEALADLKSAIDESGAVVTHDELPSVFGSKPKLRQLLQNLLSNAVKFRRGLPKIHIGYAQAGPFHQFLVQDNGIGIEPEYKDRIFLIFQRLHTRTEYPGTGIGLAISKKIVEQHGGRLWLESIPGTGSTFFFTLPM